MLHIYFGEMPECIYNTEVYFRNTYESKWITSDMAKQIIRDVDKSEVVSEHCIDSPVLGHIMNFGEEEFSAKILNNGVTVQPEKRSSSI